MIFLKSAFLSSVLITIMSLFAYAQDDEARQQSGLPIMVGGRAGSTLPGRTVNLSGNLIVQNFTSETNSLVFTVSVYANGQPLGRQTVKTGGSFMFNTLPDRNVVLTVEVNGMEIARYPLPLLNLPPLSNRQDMVLTRLQIEQATKERNEVIAAANFYERTEANQKLFNKALENLKDKKIDSALKLFNQITEKDDKDFVALTESANIYFAGEKYAEAEERYIESVALKPDYLPAYVNLGKLYIATRNGEKAVEILSKAVAVTPASPDANHFLGEAYLVIRKGSKAVIYLNEAIRLAPQKKADLHLRLAALYNAAGLKAEAVREYKLYLAKVPDSGDKAKIEKYIGENSGAK